MKKEETHPLCNGETIRAFQWCCNEVSNPQIPRGSKRKGGNCTSFSSINVASCSFINQIITKHSLLTWTRHLTIQRTQRSAHWPEGVPRLSTKSRLRQVLAMLQGVWRSVLMNQVALIPHLQSKECCQWPCLSRGEQVQF